MPFGAVITGDVVASTQIGKAGLRKLLKEFEAILANHRYEMYRGDSFQAYVKHPADALAVVLRLRVAAMRVNASTALPVSDVRAGIGIGQVKPPVNLLRTTTAEAFVLSGRGLEALKPPQRLVIAVPEGRPAVTSGLMVVAEFADYVLQRMTVKQATVVADLLVGRTQSETARRLRKSQATVSKHAQVAGWPQLEKLMAHYRQLTQNLTHP